MLKDVEKNNTRQIRHTNAITELIVCEAHEENLSDLTTNEAIMPPKKG